MKICHVVNRYEPKTLDEKRRHNFALGTWHYLYDLGVVSSHIFQEDLTRTSKTELGDERELPFLKDLIEISITRHNPDLIILTNVDTCFVSSIASKLDEAMGQRPARICKRINFPRLDKEIPYERMTEGKEAEYGYDLFCMERNFWETYKSYIPNVILGCHRWDMLLGDLIKILVPTAEIKNIIYHENHDFYWSKPENFLLNKGQSWNSKISEGTYEKFRILSSVASLIRGEEDKDFLIGSMGYELKSIYMQESNLLKTFCSPLL